MLFSVKYLPFFKANANFINVKNIRYDALFFHQNMSTVYISVTVLKLAKPYLCSISQLHNLYESLLLQVVPCQLDTYQVHQNSQKVYCEIPYTLEFP